MTKHRAKKYKNNYDYKSGRNDWKAIIFIIILFICILSFIGIYYAVLVIFAEMLF